MRATKLLPAIMLLFVSLTASAQDYNPFKSIGKKGKILTLSKGKYVEVFDYDTIQRIGTVLFNIRTKKIVKLLNSDEVNKKFSDNSSSSRWYSPDPLADKGKNISYSPYVYTFNNPINYVDPDGQDGIRVVDEKNKTITITAVYYVQTEATSYADGSKTRQQSGYSADDISKMQTGYNKYLNGLGMSVSEGDYKGYTVKFDLQFKDGGSASDSRDKADGEKKDGISVGNSLIKQNSTQNPRFATTEKEADDGTTTTRTVGGTTESNKYVTMNNREDSKMNRIHEIFHTLGLSHPRGTGGSAGIMQYPPEKPNQNDVNAVANGAFLPVVKVKPVE